MRLASRLLLFDYVTSLLGGSAADLRGALKRAEHGRRADGQSLYFSVLESRGSLIGIERSQLAEYDMNVLAIEDRLGRFRSGFRFTYFQYLAALYAEIYLHRLSKDPEALLGDLRDHQQKRFRELLPPLDPDDLRKVAFWMATGSGKTLLAHANLEQFLRYRPFAPDNVLLVTPSPTMTSQHLEELAASGIAARYALTDGSPDEVQVLEITKLYVDHREAQAPRGGESLPTSTFEGSNLVLVDEGHKGSTTPSDQAEERRWRDIRQALAGRQGFTFEYSATFAQITEANDELLEEYGKTILFDYGYRHFWEDGYGKDYRVVNVKEAGAFDTDELLLAGLLVFYEQTRLFLDARAELEPYNLEAPLMVFIGATVTGKVESEVLQILRFLNRVLVEPEWARDRIAALLAGQIALSSDVFSHRFPYLDEIGMSPDGVYDDLRRRLFRGTGRLTLHLIRRSDGEIGIRAADAAEDVYCGVINVGNATGFVGNAEKEGIPRGEDDHITDSVFDAIDGPDSSVGFLVGSKKFIEGWSSWRVSVMGLLKVGKSAGPQIIQLFGRGVRLKGKGFQLRRSTEVPGSHPDHLRLLETLHVFGLEADYMEAFHEAVRREGVPPPVARVLPIRIDESLDDLALQAPDPSGYDFFTDDVVTFNPEALAHPIEIDLMPTFTVAEGVGELRRSEAGEPARTAPLPVSAVNAEALYLDLLEFKRWRGWYNTYVTRAAVRQFLETKTTVRAPESLFALETDRGGEIMHAAASDALRKGLERFVYSEQRVRETKHLTARPVDDTHPNFPRVMAEAGEEPGYRLEVPEDLVKEVDTLISGLSAGTADLEDLRELLPRLHLDVHLYNPVLVRESDVDERGQQQALFHQVAVRSTPSGLVESEVTFLRDLRDFWSTKSGDPEWDGFEIHLLRNLPRRGVGFFETAGFYPDFMLWLKREDVQALAFVEPHGMVIWDPNKVQLLTDIRELGLSVPTVAYIVTKTEPRSIGAVGARTGDREWLRERRILFQTSPTYVEEILTDLRNAIEAVVAGQYAEGDVVAGVRQTDVKLYADEEVPEDLRFVEHLPVYSLRAAAGHFGSGHEVERQGWVRVDGRLGPDMFVAEAVGRSMEPRIRDGELCVFRRYAGGSRQGKIVLVQWAGASDPETGGAYAIKQYSSERRVVDDELVGWRVKLSSLNSEFDPIELDAETRDEVQVIAEFVEVLKPPRP